MRASVLTHRRLQTDDGMRALTAAARRAGVELCFTEAEAEKHEIAAGPGIVVGGEHPPLEVDICVVLGGDGTILTALRRYADTPVPVFAVNYGDVGFLATIDPNGMEADFARAFRGEFETRELPAITAGRPDGTWVALNDISLQRRPGLRVADLAYALSGEEIGRVRCDGLVVSTPQGSTGYNLANGGPILAWGVEGYVVSFIAPHSLTARALVIAPSDELTIANRSPEESVMVFADGRPVCELAAGEDLHVGFGATRALLAQLPGASFYGRLQERFGRLAH